MSLAALFNRPSHTNRAYVLTYGDRAPDCAASKQHINRLRTAFIKRFGKQVGTDSYRLGSAVAAWGLEAQGRQARSTSPQTTLATGGRSGVTLNCSPSSGWNCALTN